MTKSRLPTLSSHAVLLLLLLVDSLVAGQNDTSSGGTQPPDDDTYNYGRKFNPSMAIIMVVLVSAFFLMGFFSVYVRQCAERRYAAGGGSEAEQGGPFALGRRSLRGAARGLDRSVIETFPTFMYSSVKGLKNGKGSLECAVCLNEFQDDHVLRLLPKCSHVFHHDCVDTWLFSHNTCPVCRANLVPAPGETIEPPIIQPEPDPVLNHGEPSPDHVPISIDNNSTVSPQTDENNHPSNKTKPPRSRSTGMRFTRLFSRSHSTGHSLVQAGEDQERFTLRLPDNVRNQMIIDAQLNRAKSCTVAFPRARSMRTGYRRSRSGGGRNNFNYERFDKEERTGPWGFSMTPPFISRTGSVRSPLPRAAASDGMGHTPTRSSSKSGKPSQFDRIFLGLDIESGERSTDPLRAHSPL